MQLNFSEKEETIRRLKEVVFITPARTENNPHRSAIQKASCTVDGSFMLMSYVCFSFKYYFEDLAYTQLVCYFKGWCCFILEFFWRIETTKKRHCNILFKLKAKSEHYIYFVIDLKD